MDGYLEHQLICRACLRLVENKSQSFGYIEDSNGNLKDMIMCCVPEMDIYVSSHPIMCVPCIQQLVAVYNFKTRCLNTETIIRSYIQRNNLTEYNHVNLSCVVQELVKLNNYFRDMQSRKRIEAEHPNNLHVTNQSALPHSESYNSQLKELKKDPESSQIGGDFSPQSEGEKPCVEQSNAEMNQTERNSTPPQSQKDAQCDFPESQIEEQAYLSQTQEEQTVSHFDVTRNEIVERSLPPPQLIERQNFPQYNLAINHPPERIFAFPPPPNMEQRMVHFNIPPNQMGERMFALPPLGMEQRMPNYNIPRGQMFTFPPLRMGPPRLSPYNMPAHVRERIYGLPTTHMEQRLPHYTMRMHHMPERIYYFPQMQVEQSVLQPAKQGEENQLSSSERQQAPVQCRVAENGCSPKQVADEREVQMLSSAENKTPAEEESISETPEGNSISSNGSETDGKKEETQSAQNKMRIVLRIDKSRIINNIEPYDKNEDSNEKENEQQDVEMTENGMPPPENGIFLHPAEYNQELYQCSNCTFITTNPSYHMAHKKICLNELDKNEKKCPHCPHVTNRQYALNKHINTMHTKAVWYTCEFCTYRSTDSSCLRRHKRNVHPEIVGSELTCHMCSYRCTTEYHLRKHLLKHDENTILQCQFCSYSTRDRSNFRKHIFIHNPRTQECEFCAYKCVSPYQMKVHLKKYHHGVGLEDIDCRSDVSLSEVVDDISNAINESKGLVGHMAE